MNMTENTTMNTADTVITAGAGLFGSAFSSLRAIASNIGHSVIESAGSVAGGLAKAAGTGLFAATKGVDTESLAAGVRGIARNITSGIAGFGRNVLETAIGKDNADSAIESAKEGASGFRDFFRAIAQPAISIAAPIAERFKESFDKAAGRSGNDGPDADDGSRPSLIGSLISERVSSLGELVSEQGAIFSDPKPAIEALSEHSPSEPSAADHGEPERDGMEAEI